MQEKAELEHVPTERWRHNQIATLLPFQLKAKKREIQWKNDYSVQ